MNRSGVMRCAALASSALVALTLLAVAPASAADAKAAKPAVTAKPAKTAKSKAAATPKAPKAKAPEKSLAEEKAENGPWAKTTNWLSFRAGYARNSDPNAGDGMYGYGVGYQRMLSSRVSFGASVQHDILGHLGASQEITVPFTVEFDRHFAWKGAFRPYVGLGGGYYFHKYYRTATANTGAPGAGVFLSFGGNLPVDDRHLIGIDARVSHVNGRDGIVNPVFGAEKASMNFWSIKVNWAYAY